MGKMGRNHSNGSPLWGGPLSFIDDADAGKASGLPSRPAFLCRC